MPRLTKYAGSFRAGPTAGGWSWSEVALASVILFLASIGTIFRTLYASVHDVVGLPPAVFGALFGAYCLGIALAVNRLLLVNSSRVSPRAIRGFLILVVVGLAVWPLIAPTGIDGRADRDDALQIGTDRLIHGLDPWDGVTQLGNHISPLLGGLLLSMPFALVGFASLQAAFWGTVGAWLGDRYLGTRRIGALAVLLVTAPVILNEIAFESDLWVLGVVTAVAALLGHKATARGSASLLVASAVLMSLVVADRFTFIAVVAPTVLLVRFGGGGRAAMLWAGAWGAVTLLLYGLMVWRWPASLESIALNVGKSAAASAGASGLAMGIAVVALGLVGGLVARSVSGFMWVLTLTLAALPLAQGVFLLLEGSPTTFNDYRVVAYTAPALVLGLLALLVPRAVGRAV